MSADKEKSLRSHFAKRLRELRHMRGMSQEEFADKCGLHRTYIGSVERGERNISIDNIEKIAQCLGVRPSDILEDFA